MTTVLIIICILIILLLIGYLSACAGAERWLTLKEWW
jgi:cell division protein FtsW (lipid II flippase)